MHDLRHCPSFLADPTPPNTPPLSPKKINLPDVDADDQVDTEYEVLNAQLRKRIQDYEIALLRMQLRQRDRELQAMSQAKRSQDAENKVTELVLRIGRQEEQIEKLTAEVQVWKTCALEARDMLELTYKDMNKMGGVEHVTAT